MIGGAFVVCSRFVCLFLGPWSPRRITTVFLRRFSFSNSSSTLPICASGIGPCLEMSGESRFEPFEPADNDATLRAGRAYFFPLAGPVPTYIFLNSFDSGLP